MQQSAKLSTHARQKGRAKRKSATLKKLYNRLKKVSARPHRNKEQERSRIVVLWLRVVVHLLMSRPWSLHLHTAIAAARSFVRESFGEKVCRIGL